MRAPNLMARANSIKGFLLGTDLVLLCARRSFS